MHFDLLDEFQFSLSSEIELEKERRTGSDKNSVPLRPVENRDNRCKVSKCSSHSQVVGIIPKVKNSFLSTVQQEIFVFRPQLRSKYALIYCCSVFLIFAKL